MGQTDPLPEVPVRGAGRNERNNKVPILDDIAAERQRLTDRLERIDAEWERLVDGIGELDAAERALSRLLQTAAGRRGRRRRAEAAGELRWQHDAKDAEGGLAGLRRRPRRRRRRGVKEPVGGVLERMLNSKNRWAL